MKFKEAVSYDDMLMVPQYSDIQSRSEVDISSELGVGKTLQIPIIASPMDTISEDQMALAMDSLGGMAIIHRYNTIQEQQEIAARVVQKTDWTGNLAAAIGVTGDYMERSEALIAVGVDTLCVDVAHGHHILMKETLQNLKKEYNNHIHIIAGNVCTLEGVNDLADWGADSIRCNIGGGSICSTRMVTGHGLPGLQTIFDCARTDRDVAIIADGGIKTSGDIVKALAAGADFVMCGSLLAGTDETPGEIVHLPSGDIAKVYRGMASRNAQMDWRGKTSSPEGVSSYVHYKGSVQYVLDDIIGGIKSGFSYSGARDLTELRNKVEWARQTTAGTQESGTHIKERDAR